jgi:DNA-binding GntR family transcriptional regulator
LFDAADCYRHLSRVSSLQRNQPRKDEHKLIMDAVLSRNTGEALRLIKQHVTRTADLVRTRLVVLARESERLAALSREKLN